MPVNANEEADGELPPPGTRWGTGAQSVLPYLTKTLQARPKKGPEARDGREARGREGDHVSVSSRT